MTIKCLSVHSFCIVYVMKLILFESNVPARMNMCLGTRAHVPGSSGGLAGVVWFVVVVIDLL